MGQTFASGREDGARAQIVLVFLALSLVLNVVPLSVSGDDS